MWGLNSSSDHVVLFTFGFLLHQQTGHTFLFSHYKGNISWFLRGYHLQGQTVHSALAAHLIQIIILEEVVCEPPFSVCHGRVWQLNFKDCILPSGDSDIVEFSDDAHTLWWGNGIMVSDQTSENLPKGINYEGVSFIKKLIFIFT